MNTHTQTARTAADRRKIDARSYLRLMRIPNVFTAFADVVAGVCIARAGSFKLSDFWLVLASGHLYCAGMVWNDYFDRGIDARERPERPIPSGAVSETAARALAVVLSAVGLSCAALHSNVALAVGLALFAVIVAYDALVKDTWAGPLAMGGCRALNVMLGLSANSSAARSPLWMVLGTFTLLITRLSRFEVGGTDRIRVRSTLLAFSALAAAAVTLLGLYAWHSATPLGGWIVLCVASGYVLWRENKLLRVLWQAPTGPNLGRAIGGGILLMPAIDAAFVAASGAPVAAAVTFLCTVPALWLKRFYYVT